MVGGEKGESGVESEMKGVGIHGLCVCITMKTGLISLDRFGHGFVSLAIEDVGVC